MTKAKAAKAPDTMELFDAAPYFVEPVHDDAEDFWVPPATVHNFGVQHLAHMIHPQAKVPEPVRVESDSPAAPPNRLGGMVVRFEVAGYPSLMRIRDARKLEGSGNEARLYQVTIRRYTAGGKEAKEWRWFRDGAYYRYGYAWADLADEDLRLRYAVVLDVDDLMEDLAPGARPGVFVRNPKDGKELYRAPGGERFYAVDLRHLRPETIKGTVGFEIPHVAPDPVLL